MRYGTNRTTNHSIKIVIEHFLYAGTVLDTGDEVESGKLNLALWSYGLTGKDRQCKLSHNDDTKRTQVGKRVDESAGQSRVG